MIFGISPNAFYSSLLLICWYVREQTIWNNESREKNVHEIKQMVLSRLTSPYAASSCPRVFLDAAANMIAKMCAKKKILRAIDIVVTDAL